MIKTRKVFLIGSPTVPSLCTHVKVRFPHLLHNITSAARTNDAHTGISNSMEHSEDTGAYSSLWNITVQFSVIVLCNR